MSIQLSKPESVGMCSTRLARIHDVMQQQIDTGLLSGISTLIARKDKVVHCEYQGFADRDAKTPMQADTLVRFYSMTKPIVSTAFMILYEQGLCDLREPVAKYIPAFGSLKVLEKDSKQLVDLNQPMLIHHLLTHTSGLGYDFYDEYPTGKLYRDNHISSVTRDVSLEKFVDNVAKLPLAFQPGENFLYSIGIDIIARLIEIISGKPLNQFLKDNIFDPLSMTDMAFYVPEEKRHRMASVYGGADICGPGVNWTILMDVWERGVNERLDVSKTDPVDNSQFMRGGLGLKGTMQDYFAFTQMLLNGGIYNNQRILSPKTIEFMHINHLKPSHLPIHFEDITLPGYGFGLGSRVHLNPGESKLMTSVGEYGWAGAAKTYYWIDPKEHMLGIFITQSMCNYSMIEAAFQTLAYQSIVE